MKSASVLVARRDEQGAMREFAPLRMTTRCPLCSVAGHRHGAECIHCGGSVQADKRRPASGYVRRDGTWQACDASGFSAYNQEARHGGLAGHWGTTSTRGAVDDALDEAIADKDARRRYTQDVGEVADLFAPYLHRLLGAERVKPGRLRVGKADMLRAMGIDAESVPHATSKRARMATTTHDLLAQGIKLPSSDEVCADYPAHAREVAVSLTMAEVEIVKALALWAWGRRVRLTAEREKTAVFRSVDAAVCFALTSERVLGMGSVSHEVAESRVPLRQSGMLPCGQMKVSTTHHGTGVLRVRNADAIELHADVHGKLARSGLSLEEQALLVDAATGKKPKDIARAQLGGVADSDAIEEQAKRVRAALTLARRKAATALSSGTCAEGALPVVDAPKAKGDGGKTKRSSPTLQARDWSAEVCW